MTITATKMIATDWYQETTESLNFFIFLMAMVPPDDNNGLATSRVYTNQRGMDCSYLAWLSSTSLVSWKRTIIRMPTRVKSIIDTSKILTCSLSRKKANMTTKMGDKFETTATIVRGMYLITIFIMIVVVVPVNVLKMSEPTLSYVTQS